uniref:Uncharacterized protein n=1 Tax=Arundo donax TaxID=35708 RepID=A0A0A9F7C0_ARUDO
MHSYSNQFQGRFTKSMALSKCVHSQPSTYHVKSGLADFSLHKNIKSSEP